MPIDPHIARVTCLSAPRSRKHSEAILLFEPLLLSTLVSFGLASQENAAKKGKGLGGGG